LKIYFKNDYYRINVKERERERENLFHLRILK
jgi:hypothetical protein